jgi:N-acetylglutamate synthase-like GNAT family acetyltransferase
MGVARLCSERGAIVLRGMRVRSDVQRQGIGRKLLARVQQAIGSEVCYCIPYIWLRSFYGEAGFREVRPDEAPEFLAARSALYRSNGLDVILMRTGGSA